MTADTRQSASVMKCHKVSKDMKIYLKTNEEGGIFRNKSFIFKASIMGISLVWTIAVNPNLSVKFYNSIFSDSPQSSAGEILQTAKHKMIHEKRKLSHYRMYTPRCKLWVFKMEFSEIVPASIQFI